ncbi:hypothetical protein [Streptomyces sp. NBC_01236]|uniref:hypothetical protein n=1 Tax=Streptomyces sp. NBC_01236 TaxID=2903789 RepID=UPI002E0E3C09|nr:hypothetical protein OG324_37890 [Streptomyces sp. NBC_01236]
MADLRDTSASAHDPGLSAWLKMTVDQEDGDYATYFGSELFEQHKDLSGGHHADSDPDDAVIAALVADLVSLEARALCSTTGNDRQLARTRAAVQALAGLPDLAPDRKPDTGPFGAADMSLLLDEPDDAKFAELASDIAAAVSSSVSAGTRRLVDLTLIPATRMHDEQMFIRIIQVFEILYTHVAQCLAIAVDSLDRGDVSTTCAVLTKATGRIQATRTLFRVLTTMPPEAFSAIRNNTHGRSAIQSTSYRRVELLSATPPAGSPPSHQALTPDEAAGPTLQEVFRRRTPRLSGHDVRRLVKAMQALDSGWTTGKRTHWGITLKIIGRVPGTGGTSGADFLKARSQAPLFPFLHGPA